MLPPQVSGSDKREEAHDHADALFNGINAQILAVGMKTRARRTHAVNHRGACQCNVVCVRAAARVNPADFDAFKACSLFNLTDKLPGFFRAGHGGQICELHEFGACAFTPVALTERREVFVEPLAFFIGPETRVKLKFADVRNNVGNRAALFDDDVDAGTRTL